ncbi:hypothetical protein KP509_01G052700 [Ceratopteris richardii]|uniref:Uncharacterized protein n=1 Tax=Ceratopteris richardii TaxID=49495 RepID=A0A8T2VCY3_CERRI|nr:hypothetical protein KP509_01G052700 [Ceratopteris richardii]KAH7446357.1 hypothetical protein KP509_01G052700 [Ceratopteris richardii]
MRYGKRDLYKGFMFGQPTILAVSHEACKLVLMGEEQFVSGWPASTLALMGRKAFTSLAPHEHKRLRKLTASTLNGPVALRRFMPVLQFYITRALSQWSSSTHPIPLLMELRKLTFQIIAEIFMGCKPGERCNALEQQYQKLNVGVRAMPIRFPGTAYHTALKCRKGLVKLLQQVLDDRKSSTRQQNSDYFDDTLEVLMAAKDEEGNTLTDEEIIDVLLMYLNAGHESSAHTIMWILINLKNNSQAWEKVEREQLLIRQSKGANKSLDFEDFRKMKYTSQVIDETLRLINISPMVFRKSLTDVEMNGYTIPKGWHVQAWMRQVHLDPDVYNDPLAFNPDRWENFIPRQGTFIPFGAGVHMCPGNDFAKLEMSIFLHYAILDYVIQPQNPHAEIVYLPHPKPKDNYPVHVFKREVFFQRKHADAQSQQAQQTGQLYSN